MSLKSRKTYGQISDASYMGIHLLGLVGSLQNMRTVLVKERFKHGYRRLFLRGISWSHSYHEASMENSRKKVLEFRFFSDDLSIKSTLMIHPSSSESLEEISYFDFRT